jgi:hypothetical protein
MRTLIFSLVAFATAAECQELLPATGQLRVEAAPALVVLDPLADRRQSVLLPNLEFELSIETRCEPGSGSRSVVVSVADTRLQLDQDDFGQNGTARTALLLPTRQAGQLRADGFCQPGRDDNDSRLEVQGAFTARLSLRCDHDELASITYATLPLDVVLECRTKADGDAAKELPRQSTLRF